MYTNQNRDAFTTFGLGFHVSAPAAALPQTNTAHLFTVSVGRILVTLLFGEVTVAIAGTDPVAKITSTPSVAGTAVDVASTVDLSSLEVGGLIVVEGDGTALVKNNAGAGLEISGVGMWICPIGTIDLITGASKAGTVKWELFYFPIDIGATVAAS
jgi:hypothetical protein